MQFQVVLFSSSSEIRQIYFPCKYYANNFYFFSSPYLKFPDNSKAVRKKQQDWGTFPRCPLPPRVRNLCLPSFTLRPPPVATFSTAARSAAAAFGVRTRAGHVLCACGYIGGAFRWWANVYRVTAVSSARREGKVTELARARAILLPLSAVYGPGFIVRRDVRARGTRVCVCVSPQPRSIRRTRPGNRGCPRGVGGGLEAVKGAGAGGRPRRIRKRSVTRARARSGNPETQLRL